MFRFSGSCESPLCPDVARRALLARIRPWQPGPESAKLPRVSPDLKSTAEAAVREARSALLGTVGPKVEVESVFWYGAVDIDPAHLVVWILLSGRPDAELPTWCFPDRGIIGENASLDAELIAWIQEARRIVVEKFATVGWPSAATISVGFDSLSRVDAQGGWRYFM